MLKTFFLNGLKHECSHMEPLGPKESKPQYKQKKLGKYYIHEVILPPNGVLIFTKHYLLKKNHDMHNNLYYFEIYLHFFLLVVAAAHFKTKNTLCTYSDLSWSQSVKDLRLITWAILISNKKNKLGAIIAVAGCTTCTATVTWECVLNS